MQGGYTFTEKIRLQKLRTNLSSKNALYLYRTARIRNTRRILQGIAAVGDLFYFAFNLNLRANHLGHGSKVEKRPSSVSGSPIHSNRPE